MCLVFLQSFLKLYHKSIHKNIMIQRIKYQVNDNPTQPGEHC